MMNRVIFLLFATLPLIALAEGESGSLLNEDKVWTMGYFSPYQEGKVDYIEYKFEGDIVIGDVTYKRQYTRVLKQGEGVPQDWKPTDYYVGQDKGKIYCYNKTSQEEPLLLMDFSATVREIIPYIIDGMPSYLKVENVSDTIFVNSKDKQCRKCIYIRDIEHDVSDVWIDGIGSLEYGMEPYFIYRLTGSFPKLLKCTEGDNILYEHSDAAIITSVCLPSIRDRVADSVIYDLQGRRISSLPQKGVYIQNGKKIVVK